MKRKIIKTILISVPTISAFVILYMLFYVITDIGLVSEYSYYVPMYAPLWFEALVTLLFVPFVIGFSIYDYLY